MSSSMEKFILISLCSVIVSGCMVKNIPVRNIVMFNKSGQLVDPTDNLLGLQIPGLKYDSIANPPDYFEKIITALKNHPPSDNGKRKVLFFIHGGLNTQRGTIQRARDLSPKIIKDGYYPVFVNWRSSLISSYMNHLLWIRQGRDWGWKLSMLAPVYFSADVARGVVRFPIVSLSQIKSDFMTLPFLKPFSKELCTAKKLIQEYHRAEISGEGAQTPIPISVGRDERSKGETVFSFITYVLTTPFKWVVAPIGTDTFGTSSWEMMNRNARMLFHSEEEFFKGSPYMQQSGGLYQFMNHFQQEVNKKPEDWEITIIGHSMGTIVANELIRSFDLNYANIIYMAGATSIRDYEETIFPYLKRHPETKLYHLTLHPIAEIRDRWGEKFFGIDPPMRGSLLVWVDQFLSQPETPLDMTVGSLTNLMRAIHDTPGLVHADNRSVDLRSQIHIKSFGVGKDRNRLGPQKHGEFNEFEFWKPEFWKVEKTSGGISSYQCWEALEE